jgi:hypothetical protein
MLRWAGVFTEVDLARRHVTLHMSEWSPYRRDELWMAGRWMLPVSKRLRP